MAQQAVRKQAESAPPVAGAPRLRKGKTGALPVSYDRYRLTFTEPDAFLEFMRGYPNRDGVTLFLYRLVPKIDLSLIGLRESNVQKGGYGDLNLFTPEAVAEKFGRGKYQVKVTDSNRLDGQREVVKACYYKLTDAEKPPVYDVRTLELGHSDNIDEVNRLITSGVLIRDASGAPRIRTAADSAAPAGAPVSSVASEIGGKDLVGQIVLAALNTAKQSPHDAVRDTIDVARMLTPQQPALDIETIVERVVARLRPAAPAAGPLDLFSQYDQVQTFIERVRGPVAAIAGDGAAAAVTEAGSVWAPHLGGILAQARALIPEVVGAFKELRIINGNGTANAAPQNGGGQPRVMTLDQRIEDVFKRGYESMMQGVTGFDFASWVCFHYPGGLEVYKALEPAGAQGLIAAAAMNPQARPLVNDPKLRPQLEAFLTDFFSFVPEGAEELPSAASS